MKLNSYYKIWSLSEAFRSGLTPIKNRADYYRFCENGHKHGLKPPPNLSAEGCHKTVYAGHWMELGKAMQKRDCASPEYRMPTEEEQMEIAISNFENEETKRKEG